MCVLIISEHAYIIWVGYGYERSGPLKFCSWIRIQNKSFRIRNTRFLGVVLGHFSNLIRYFTLWFRIQMQPNSPRIGNMISCGSELPVLLASEKHVWNPVLQSTEGFLKKQTALHHVDPNCFRTPISKAKFYSLDRPGKIHFFDSHLHYFTTPYNKYRYQSSLNPYPHGLSAKVTFASSQAYS